MTSVMTSFAGSGLPFYNLLQNPSRLRQYASLTLCDIFSSVDDSALLLRDWIRDDNERDIRFILAPSQNHTHYDKGSKIGMRYVSMCRVLVGIEKPIIFEADNCSVALMRTLGSAMWRMFDSLKTLGGLFCEKKAVSLARAAI